MRTLDEWVDLIQNDKGSIRMLLFDFLSEYSGNQALCDLIRKDLETKRIDLNREDVVFLSRGDIFSLRRLSYDFNREGRDRIGFMNLSRLFEKICDMWEGKDAEDNNKKLSDN